jgi:hypothetical protein
MNFLLVILSLNANAEWHWRPGVQNRKQAAG